MSVAGALAAAAHPAKEESMCGFDYIRPNILLRLQVKYLHYWNVLSLRIPFVKKS